MDYVKLGRTGLDVSRICLGCMSYGGGNRGNHAWSLSEEESKPVIKKALEAGINFFDTANRYSLGKSEEAADAGETWISPVISANSASFRRVAFAHAYLTRNLPMRWFASSLDLPLRRHADHGAADLGAEVVRDRTLGWESRPFRRWQNLEFRVGDNVTFHKSQGAH